MSEQTAPPSQSFLLTRLFTGEGIFGEARHLLAGLEPELAVAVPADLERSVAAHIAHCAGWLGLYLEIIRTGDASPLDGPIDDWPVVSAPEWQALVGRFECLVDEALALSRDAERLAATVSIHGRNIAIATLLGDLAGHNAYHLGQVVLTRRLLGAWPPAA